MKAIILAAGEGKKMLPLTYTRAKAMLPLANKPMLEYLLIELRKAGIEQFLFIVGYYSEGVREYFGSGERWRVRIEYVTQERQLGTADALRRAQGLIDDKFLLSPGDVVVKGEDILKLLNGDGFVMGLIKAEYIQGEAVVEVQGSRVVQIRAEVKEDASNLVNAGIYLLTPDIFSAILSTPLSPRGEYELPDSLQLLINQGYPIFYEIMSSGLDLSHPWDLLEANERIMAQLRPENVGQIEENVVIKGPVSVGRGTVIRSGSYVIGPVIIGEKCVIGPNCYIRGYTAIGDRCHIGSAVEVKNSIIMPSTRIPHHNYVGDSVIGEDCNLGAGAKIANLRLDKKDVQVAGINTGRQKLGAIIGNGVQTGINVSIDAGCVIGNDSFIGPGATVTGVVLPNSKIF